MTPLSSDLNLIEQLRHRFERSGFEVCSRLGFRMGIPASRIRMFFVSASFLALGSPIVIYMALAFVLELKKMMNPGFRSLREL